MSKSKAGKAKVEEKVERQAAEKIEAFTHKRGVADTSGDKPGYPAGAHLDAPAAGEVQS